MSSILYEFYTSGGSFLNGFWPATNIASKVREDAVWHLVQVRYLCQRENTAWWVFIDLRVFTQETATVGEWLRKEGPKGSFLVRTHVTRLWLIRRSGGNEEVFPYLWEWLKVQIFQQTYGAWTAVHSLDEEPSTYDLASDVLWIWRDGRQRNRLHCYSVSVTETWEHMLLGFCHSSGYMASRAQFGS